MIYPEGVQIETVATCNYHCWFCTHPLVKRTDYRMRDDLLDSVIDQIASYPNSPQVCPFLNNEPFADPRMPYIIQRLINQTSCPIVFFSNGSLLDNSIIQAITKPERVRIFFSLHTLNETEYFKLTGHNLYDVVNNIKQFISQCPCRVEFVSVGDYPHFKRGIAKTFGEQYPVTQAGISNWAGSVNLKEQSPRLGIGICTRPTHICVFSDGRVPLCCLDYNGRHQMGDANTTPLLEIFNSPTMEIYRVTKKDDIVPCKFCNA